MRSLSFAAALLALALCLASCAFQSTTGKNDTESAVMTESGTAAASTDTVAESDNTDTEETDAALSTDPESETGAETEAGAEVYEPSDWENRAHAEMNEKSTKLGYLILNESVDPITGTYADNKDLIDGYLKASGASDLLDSGYDPGEFYIDACGGTNNGGGCYLALILPLAGEYDGVSVVDNSSRVSIVSVSMDPSNGDFVPVDTLFETDESYNGEPLIVQWASNDFFGNVRIIVTSFDHIEEWAPVISGEDGNLTLVGSQGSLSLDLNG